MTPLAEITTATRTLLATAAKLDDDDVRAFSLLPGWTRGHVLTHVARNADGGTRLLTWARTGVESYEYPSLEARATEIEDGARHPAARATDARLTEILVHHVDLDAGFAPRDWPANFTTRMLASVTTSYARREDAPALRLRATDTGEEHGHGDHLVTGPATSLLAWLMGRTPGTDLTGTKTLTLPFLY